MRISRIAFVVAVILASTQRADADDLFGDIKREAGNVGKAVGNVGAAVDPFSNGNVTGHSIDTRKIIPRVPRGSESTSGLTVITPPRMDRDGYIYNGTTRSDYPSNRVARGDLRHDSDGRGWWHSNYSDRYTGRVNSPGRLRHDG